ncbi:MAG: DUF1343 domain-containing protein [Bacteroidales bacterium]|nr:DUF1343 domain-containing protein [Bacteroidales bacterium]
MILGILYLISFNSCNSQVVFQLKHEEITCGADRTERYLSLLQGKRVGVVANASSRIGEVHLVDSLLRLGINIRRVFAPEHGFRGNMDAGAIVKDGYDPVTGLPVSSLYSVRKKPDAADLKDLDLMLFDLQDVGVRFYTYLSTLHYVMESCAENDLPLLLLDRPNPNGFYVDGPVLEPEYRSFVGMHPVPVVYGMTLGEYAGMINGEKWLKEGVQCRLTVISCEGYDHLMVYDPPVRPSPNLPNLTAINLYPSLCFFEGTVVSVGRGTPWPFQVFGHPDFDMPFTFKPEPVAGASLHPKFEGEVCHGIDLRNNGLDSVMNRPGLYLGWLIDAYRTFGLRPEFFNDYFDRLAGTGKLREQILKGWSEKQIRAAWEPALNRFRKVRSRYLIYP